MLELELGLSAPRVGFSQLEVSFGRSVLSDELACALEGLAGQIALRLESGDLCPELGVIDLNPETQIANVMVTLKWYEIPYYIIRETRLRETWTFDEQTEYWVLTERRLVEEGSARAQPPGRR